MNPLSLLFGSGKPAGKPAARRVTRTVAAKLCTAALLRHRVIPLIAQVYAPRGDVGRVAIPLALMASPPKTLGWIEIPLTGEITLQQDGSSLAAQLAPHITKIIVEAFANANIGVEPVAADARTWVRHGYRIRQAPSGLWNVVGVGDNEVRAALNTPEEAMLAAERAPWNSASAPVATTTTTGNAGDGNAPTVVVEMEREHAARWIASLLSERGYPTRAEKSVVFVEHEGGQGRERRVDLTLRGPVYENPISAGAREQLEAALAAVRLVDRLG